MHGNSLAFLLWVPQHNMEVSAMVLVIVSPLSSPFLYLPILAGVSASLGLCLSVSVQLSPSIGGCAPFICLAASLARSFWSSQPHFASSLIEFLSQSEFWCPCSPNICLRFSLWCLPNGPLGSCAQLPYYILACLLTVAWLRLGWGMEV